MFCTYLGSLAIATIVKQTKEPRQVQLIDIYVAVISIFVIWQCDIICTRSQSKQIVLG